MTKSQIRKLGDRLREGNPTEADVRLLDDYRRSFAEAYRRVESTLRDRLRLAPTGREAKTTSTIIAKLRREKTDLSSMQDIAGCRVVVQNFAAQEAACNAISEAFPDSKQVDRRKRPSHGYRAVHLIVKAHEKLVEVQVRTELQHMWALFSEKLSGTVDLAIKYGGGPQNIRKLLLDTSELIFMHEAREWGNALSKAHPPPGHNSSQWHAELDEERKLLEAERQAILEVLRRAVAAIEKGGSDAVFD